MPSETRLMRKRRLINETDIVDENWENIHKHYVDERQIKRNNFKTRNATMEETIVYTWESHQVVETFHEMLVNDVILRKKVKNDYYESSNGSVTLKKETRQILTCMCDVPCFPNKTYEVDTVIENGNVIDSRVKTNLSASNVLLMFKIFHYLWCDDYQRDLFLIPKEPHLVQFPPNIAADFTLDKSNKRYKKSRNGVTYEASYEENVKEQQSVMKNSFILRKEDTFSKKSKHTEVTPVISVTTSRFMTDESKEKCLQLKGNIESNGNLNMQPNHSTGILSDVDFFEEWNDRWNDREIRRDRLRLSMFSNRNIELFSNDQTNNLDRTRYRAHSFGTQTD